MIRRFIAGATLALATLYGASAASAQEDPAARGIAASAQVTAKAAVPSASYNVDAFISKAKRMRAKAQSEQWWDAVMASPPTMTVTQNGANLANVYTAAPSGILASQFTLMGGPTVIRLGTAVTCLGATIPGGATGNQGASGPGGAQMNAYGCAVEFMTDAATLQVTLYGGPTAARVLVNDQYVSKAGTAMAASGMSQLSIPFGSNAVRRIRVEFEQNNLFFNASVGSTEKVWRVPQQDIIRGCFGGDSVEAGTGTGTGSTFPATFVSNGWVQVAAKMMGWRSAQQVAQGGTALLNPGANVGTFISHVADFQASSCDVAVLKLVSTNDYAYGTTAQITAAAVQYVQAVRAQLPGRPIIAMGAWPASTGPSTTVMASETSVLNAITAMNDPLVRVMPIVNAADGSPITGTGYLGHTTGVGNADRYIADGTHPNDGGPPYTNAGHDFFGRWAASRISDALASLTSTVN